MNATNLHKNYGIFFFILMGFLSFINAQAQTGFKNRADLSTPIDTILPMETQYWLNTNCGNFVQNADTLHVEGGGYRIGGNMYSQSFFNFRNDGEAYFKWRAEGQGQWEAATACINAVPSNVLTGSNLHADTWYYSHIKINSIDSTFIAKVCTGNYDDQGGTVVMDRNGSLSDRWDVLKSTNVYLKFWDNYGGAGNYMDLAEAKLRNVIPVDNDNLILPNEEVYDFEDGQIPANIQFIGAGWQVDSTMGANSNASLHVTAPVHEERAAYMDLNDVVKVSFDVKYYAENHKHFYFCTDSITGTYFAALSPGCWRHYEWRFNDDQLHRIYWKIQGSQYDQSTGELWIDNIRISHRTHTSDIESGEQENFSIYPNPVKNILHLKTDKYLYYRIMDIDGKILYKSFVNKNAQIDLSSLPKGIYFVAIRDDKNEQVRKIIKQ